MLQIGNDFKFQIDEIEITFLIFHLSFFNITNFAKLTFCCCCRGGRRSCCCRRWRSCTCAGASRWRCRCCWLMSFTLIGNDFNFKRNLNFKKHFIKPIFYAKFTTKAIYLYFEIWLNKKLCTNRRRCCRRCGRRCRLINTIIVFVCFQFCKNKTIQI